MPALSLCDHLKNDFEKFRVDKKLNDHIFIPLESIHRIQNTGKKPVKIIEAQVGSILKETDIVRYQDVYGRVK